MKRMRFGADGRMMYLTQARSWKYMEWDSFCMDDILTDDFNETRNGRPFMLIKCLDSKEEIVSSYIQYYKDRL